MSHERNYTENLSEVRALLARLDERSKGQADDTATIMDHLEKLNGAVAEHARLIAEGSTDIAVISTRQTLIAGSLGVVATTALGAVVTYVF